MIPAFLAVLLAAALIGLSVGLTLLATHRLRRLGAARYRTMPLAAAREHLLCPYCGGVHSYLCGRILRITYDPSVEPPRVLGVEFDPRYGRLLWDDTIWPEDEAVEPGVGR